MEVSYLVVTKVHKSFWYVILQKVWEIHKGVTGFPQISVGICNIWRLNTPMSKKHLEVQSNMQKLTNLQNLSSHAVEIKSSLYKVSEYFPLDFLTVYSDMYHILLQVPLKKTLFQRSQGAKLYVLTCNSWFRLTHWWFREQCYLKQTLPGFHNKSYNKCLTKSWKRDRFLQNLLAEAFASLESNDVNKATCNNIPHHIKEFEEFSGTTVLKITKWPVYHSEWSHSWLCSNFQLGPSYLWYCL